ncbi:hypothetical protein GIB64_11630 [Pseudomonas lactis]|mgnify:CR=1 FL=1|uniref:Uncharacterized protein n=1 Tax=Pseudomonas fluorescens TaxID=294 RepID=A0A109KX93_PSEFL|nr:MULTISPECIES: hypothetical protein [Pseudomonas]KWV74966.1 hypothetical protein PFLuk1_00697 [Pseudomonas fluorescens]KWV77105.1 hypothetical protein PFLmoz3_06088 [Pseudomonas fluorescens]MBA5958081.1 hypothetical protein [Pseudomonas lactis]MBV2082399.1 hypothetical protein [Pseudomonas carnis]MBV2088109.1 hypothetical protein [Pseudomonas carnis]
MTVQSKGALLVLIFAVLITWMISGMFSGIEKLKAAPPAVKQQALKP